MVTSLDEDEGKQQVDERQFRITSQGGVSFLRVDVASEQSSILQNLAKTEKEFDVKAKERNEFIPLYIDMTLPYPHADVESVITYLNHHFQRPANHIEQPLDFNEVNAFASSWDAEFLLESTPLLDAAKADKKKLTPDRQKRLVNLLLLGSFLDVDPLVQLVSAYVASLAVDKTPEQIRKVFAIKSDFTASEEQYAREQTKWATLFTE